MTENLTIAETLNKAADLIEERGWVQGDGWMLGHSGPSDPLCLEGAVAAAAGIDLGDDDNPDATGPGYDRFIGCPVYAVVQSYLGLAKQDCVFFWNDRTGRTAAQVIEALRACAVIEAARETSAVAETHAPAGLPGDSVSA